MTKGRMEAFSDGVLAIIITLMVIEMEPPHEATLAALGQVWHQFLVYILSFGYLGIYWNNHHHLLQAAQRVNGRILWANLHLLFWLALVPYTTNWVSDTEFAEVPVAAYGVVLLGAALAYYILTHSLMSHHGKESDLARAVGDDWKGKASLLVYVAGTVLALWFPKIAFALYAAIGLVWFIPDRRIERVLEGKAK